MFENTRWTNRPSHGPRPRGGREGAFTSVEILVVVLIVALLSSAALIGYANLNRGAALDATARQLQVTLNRARQLAIAENARHEVAIDLDNGAFWIDAVEAVPAPRYKLDGVGYAAEFVTFRSVRIDAPSTDPNAGNHVDGVRRIRFESDGRSPYVVVEMARDVDDASVDSNVVTIRVFPYGEARVQMGPES